jgi:hypothetical protein
MKKSIINILVLSGLCFSGINNGKYKCIEAGQVEHFIEFSDDFFSFGGSKFMQYRSKKVRDFYMLKVKNLVDGRWGVAPFKFYTDRKGDLVEFATSSGFTLCERIKR